MLHTLVHSNRAFDLHDDAVGNSPDVLGLIYVINTSQPNNIYQIALSITEILIP